MPEEGSKQANRTRVNCAFMPQNHGKQVCLMGTVTKCESGQSFTVKATDGGIVNIRMRQPLAQPLSGLVEVCGMGQGKNLIVGETYVAFPEEVENNFDVGAYNEMITLLNVVEGKENPWKSA